MFTSEIGLKWIEIRFNFFKEPRKRNILPLMGLFDFRDVNKRKKKRDGTVVACSATGIHLNGTPIEFPAQYTLLRDILGEASRIEPIKQTKNKVYLWDELGIYCASADPEKMLMLLLVQDNRYGLGHQPKKNFMGEVTIDGKPLANNIQNVGQDRPYMIRAIIKENQQVAIALGWNPGV
ncbi:hypothetical protein ACFQZJ_18055 [Maribacter chungangensis]|uniref:DUF7738 domain-containing protein n=2 Tax=Maribacter chungangensis TaxID=1069117 RepID=A0ABW3B925_9FLAO